MAKMGLVEFPILIQNLELITCIWWDEDRQSDTELLAGRMIFRTNEWMAKVSDSVSQTTGLSYNTKHREKYWVLETARSRSGSQSSSGTVARAWLLFFSRFLWSTLRFAFFGLAPVGWPLSDRDTMCIFFRCGESQKGRKKEEKK